jgi:hypothetical protein
MAHRETAEAVGFTPSLRITMRRFELGDIERLLHYDTNSQLYNAFLPTKLFAKGITPDDRM